MELRLQRYLLGEVADDRKHKHHKNEQKFEDMNKL